MFHSNRENVNGGGLHPKVALALMQQVTNLQRDAPEGITVNIPKDGNLSTIQARIEGPPGTPYAEALFHLYLTIPSNFPTQPPKAYFTTKIFHPNVSETGEVCVNTLKRDWDSQKWSIRHILQIIRCLLIAPFPESALNQEAGKLFMESYEDFAREARIITQVHAPSIAGNKSGQQTSKAIAGGGAISAVSAAQKKEADAKAARNKKRVLRRL